MNLLNLRKSAGVLLLSALAHAAMAQDNGNVFVKTWGADVTVFKGDGGELATHAPEGMDIDQDHHREFIVYDHVTGVFNPEDRLQLWENRGDNDFFRIIPAPVQSDNWASSIWTRILSLSFSSVTVLTLACMYQSHRLRTVILPIQNGRMKLRTPLASRMDGALAALPSMF